MFKAILTATAGLVIAGAASAQSTRWEIAERVDPIDDAVSIGAATGIGNEAFAMVGCVRGNVYIAVKTNFLDIEMGDYRDVVWRIDSNEAQRQRWENSRRGGAALYDEAAVELARQIRDASSRFVVSSGRDTREFGVSGSTTAIEKVLKHCGIE